MSQKVCNLQLVQVQIIVFESMCTCMHFSHLSVRQMTLQFPTRQLTFGIKHVENSKEFRKSERKFQDLLLHKTKNQILIPIYQLFTFRVVSLLLYKIHRYGGKVVQGWVGEGSGDMYKKVYLDLRVYVHQITHPATFAMETG